MTDAGLLTEDEVKVVSGGGIGMTTGFLRSPCRRCCIAVEAEEDTGVQAIGESGWRKRDLVGAFAFTTVDRVGQGLKCDQGLESGAPTMVLERYSV